MKIFSLALAFAVLMPVLDAQLFTDPFVYPAGTQIPGYTEQRGDWTCSGTTVQSQLGVTFQELSFDSILDTDACVEVLAIYDQTNPGLQYIGPLLRHSGSGATASYFMVKVQDNGSPYTGFDYYFTYFYNGAGAFQSVGLAAALPAPTTAARVRLQVTDQPNGIRVQVYIDTDLDGRWNVTGDTTTQVGAGSTGKIGICAYQSAIVEELRYFDVTLFANSLPTIGTALQLTGRGTPNFPYLAAASLGHAGFTGPGGLGIPLDFDWFFVLSMATPSVFSGFSGFTAPDGSFNLTVNIPNDPALSGLTFWITTILHNGSYETGVAPDTQITIL